VYKCWDGRRFPTDALHDTVLADWETTHGGHCALGGIRIPNLLIRRGLAGVAAGLGMSHEGAACAGFLAESLSH
jgi:hypothetical protein